MGQKMNRIPPKGTVRDYKTYQITAPLATHWRPASCAEVECDQYMNGWRVRVEGLPAEMVHTARTCGRKFSELEVSENEHWLVFESGQSCFRTKQHRVPVGKPELFVVRDGDFRGNPTGNRRTHSRPEHWVEDFQEHQARIADAVQKG